MLFRSRAFLTHLEIVVSGESLIADWTPHAFLMESIQLMLVVHVMILAAHVAKGGLADVALVHRLGMGDGQVVAQHVRTRKAGLADVAFVGGHGGIGAGVAMQFKMLLQKLKQYK